MADDVQANIGLNIDTSKALTGLKALQSELSALHTQLSRLGPTQRAQAAGVQRSLIDNINATGKFAASMTTVRTTAESFTNALEKNKLTMGEYFRYAGGASKSFGRNFAREFATIEKVAVERVKSLQTQYIKLGRDANGAMRSIAVRPLTLDMDNLQTKTAIAAQKQQLLNQLLKQGSTQMLNWGKNTQWAGRQLMVGFTIPLGIFAGQAMKAFSDMEKQIISFKRVYGDLSTSAKDTDAMAESIRKLAGEFTKYGLAVSDTMEMASKAAAMGKTGADLLGQVQQASKLAVLGQVEQQQALQTTISLTDTFGTSAQELGKKINFLNAVENQTAVSIEDLTIAIPKAGPVIKQLGGDVEDLAFFLTAMREGGINASEGANALKSGLAAMINPTGKAADMLQGFGINLQKIVKTNKGDVRGTVTEFAKALDKLDPLDRAKAIEQLFGKFQFARISTLMKNVVSDSSQAATTAQLAQRSSIELAALAARELRQLSSSPLYKFQKAIQDFQTQLAPIGESFMKFVTPIIDFVNGLLKSFNSLGDGTKTFIVGFTSVVAGLGPILLMTFGLVANGFANLIKGFAALKSVFNRVQTSSEILGQETRYMTEEQIKAKAVAASLDQVHGKLIQTFNVEAGSVNKLASAYERAVLASQRLMPVATGGKGSAKAPKKYASGGIIRGPGTGTSDSIIARVSNKEAIIPAKNVAKYPDLVNSLISGNIPGFKDGMTLGARLKKKTTTEFAPTAIRNQSKAMAWAGKDKEFSIMENLAQELGIDLNSQESQKRRDKVNYLNVDSSHLQEDVSMRDVGFGAKRGFKNWRPDNLFADWGSINKGINDIKTGNSMSTTGGKVKAQFAEKLQSISKSLDMDPKEVDSIAKKIFTGNHVVNQKQRAVAEKIMGLAFENAATPSEKLKYGSAQRILKSRAKTSFYDPAEVKKRKYIFSEEANRRNQDQAVAKVSKELANAPKAERDAYLKTIGQSQSKIDEGNKQVEATKRSTKAKQQTAKADESVAKSAKETEREYVKRAKQERDLGKRLTAKQKRVLEAYDAQRAAISAKARETRERNRSTRVSQSYLVSGVDQYIVDGDGSTTSTRGRRRSARTPRPPKGPGMFSKVAPFLGFGKDARNTRATSVGGFLGGGRLFGLGSAVSIGGSMLGSAVGGEAGNAIMGGSQIAGGLSMAAEFMPKLAMGIARFIPHIAVAATAFGALSFAVNKATESERKKTEAAKNTAAASGVSTKSMESLTSFFGTSLKTGSYFQTAMQNGSSSKLGPVVDELRLNEGFQQALKDEKWAESLKSGSKESNKLLLESLAIRFGADLAPDAVQAIITAIQAEAGTKTVSIDFASIDVSTKEGREGIVQNVSNTLESLQSTNAGYLGLKDNLAISEKNLSEAKQKSQDIFSDPNSTESERERSLDKVAMAEDYVETAKGAMREHLGEGDIANAENFANAYTNAITAVTSAYQSGQISLKEYKETMADLQAQIEEGLKSDDLSVRENTATAIDKMIDSASTLTTDQKKQLKGVKDLTVRYKLYTLALSDSTTATALAADIADYEARMLNATGRGLDLLIKKRAEAINKLNDLLDEGPDLPDDTGNGGNDDPYNTGKDTLSKKQQARQKQAQDGLNYLGLLEDEINVKYDKRIEALDKVAELNKEIAASQKDQLDLADALSRGDIAAAARSAQAMRANDTQREFDRQKQAIENARNNEVDSLKVKIDGVWYTREQLEAKNLIYEKKSALNAIANNTVRFAAGGGKISGPGTGTSDDIPAMLSNGEYVIRAKAVKALGVDTLDKMNHAEKFGIGGFARRFAKGGMVAKYEDGGIIERLRKFRNDERKYPQPAKLAPVVLPQMLKGTKLAARTTQDALMSMIAGDGRYKNAFETGSGEDFKDVNENSRAKWTRLNMEADALGIPKSAKPQARPTYGSLVTDSKILESLNRTLGGNTGKRFNLVSDINSDQLDRYGDISLITKNRVKNRSTFYTGDTLETYVRNGLFGKDNFGPVSTTGKPSDIFNRAALSKLAIRFGHNKTGENAYSVNNKPRYLETQTPGGFSLKDVAKIRVHSSDDAARDVLNELRNSGIKTKVYGPGGKRVRPNIVSTLLRSLGRIGGPEGMFLADALLGTSSMQMPSLPGQSKSPFASGAYANGGMVGKYEDGGIIERLRKIRNDERKYPKPKKIDPPNILKGIPTGQRVGGEFQSLFYNAIAGAFGLPYREDHMFGTDDKKSFSRAFLGFRKIANDILGNDETYSKGVKLEFQKDTLLGGYFSGDYYPNTVAIDSDNIGDRPVSIITHELGHYIDNNEIPEQFDNPKNYKTGFGNKTDSMSNPLSSYYAENRAELLSGVLQRLGGLPLGINKDFIKRYNKTNNIWQDKGINNSETDPDSWSDGVPVHFSRDTGYVLESIGYAHPEDTLKYFGIKLPKKYENYNLKGIKGVPKIGYYNNFFGTNRTKFANGGMVGPRNALMADAAERSFNKPVFKPKNTKKKAESKDPIGDWFSSILPLGSGEGGKIVKGDLFYNFDPTLLGNSNGMGTEWSSGIDTGNSLVRTLSGKGDFGDNLSSAMLPLSFFPGLGKGAAATGQAGRLAKPSLVGRVAAKADSMVSTKKSLMDAINTIKFTKYESEAAKLADPRYQQALRRYPKLDHILDSDPMGYSLGQANFLSEAMYNVQSRVGKTPLSNVFAGKQGQEFFSRVARKINSGESKDNPLGFIIDDTFKEMGAAAIRPGLKNPPGMPNLFVDTTPKDILSMGEFKFARDIFNIPDKILPESVWSNADKAFRFAESQQQTINKIRKIIFKRNKEQSKNSWYRSIIRESDKRSTFLEQSKQMVRDIIGNKVPLLPKNIDEMSPQEAALEILEKSRHRSLELIQGYLHPRDVPVKNGQMYGPGMYSANDALTSAEEYSGFGGVLHKFVMNDEVKTFVKNSKGFASPFDIAEKLVKHNIPVPPGMFKNDTRGAWRQMADTQLNRMPFDHPVIQDLVSEGFIGFKHGSANTNWLIGHNPLFKLQEAADNLDATQLDELRSGAFREALESLGAIGNPRKPSIWQKMLSGYASGGLISKVKPSYFNTGGLARGTDTIPAMLTPGEFVMTRSAVQNFGVDNLKSINSGDVSVAPSGSTSSSDSVYNYSINVNVSSMSDPNDIAKTVMTQIKRIDSQKVRGIYRG